MARIAVAGFHHETNSFVAETTDFAYFASHRDRPPLVKGEDVLTWLGDTSFALSGFLAGYAWRPRPRAAAVDQRWRRRHRDGRRLRAHCRRAVGRLSAAHARRCRLPRSPWRHGQRTLRGRRGRTVASRARRGWSQGADRHQPRLSQQRHAPHGRGQRQPDRLSHLPPRRPFRDRAVCGARAIDPSEARPADRDARCASCRS